MAQAKDQAVCTACKLTSSVRLPLRLRDNALTLSLLVSLLFVGLALTQTEPSQDPAKPEAPTVIAFVNGFGVILASTTACLLVYIGYFAFRRVDVYNSLDINGNLHCHDRELHMFPSPLLFWNYARGERGEAQIIDRQNFATGVHMKSGIFTSFTFIGPNKNTKAFKWVKLSLFGRSLVLRDTANEKRTQMQCLDTHSLGKSVPIFGSWLSFFKIREHEIKRILLLINQFNCMEDVEARAIEPTQEEDATILKAQTQAT